MLMEPIRHEQFRELSEIIFPDISETPADMEAQFPPRQHTLGRWVSRFAPSPTGFIHIGGIFAALVNRMAAINGGTFILRIEDTDQRREIERGVEMIIEALAQVDLLPDEGPYATDPVKERGNYGPYIQSQRLHIYHVFIKDLVSRGLAYPCFMSSEELDAIREEQMSKKIRPGIYGPWARGRHLSFEDIKRRIEQNEKFVIRVRAETNGDERVRIEDQIRGTLDLPANDIDAVLIKSDRFPTYHFAHVVDDLLMRVNLVLRGDEWIASIPLHVQIHNAIQAPLPNYAHFGPIAKMEGSSRRKLSKRKDPEAAMSYYYEKGYPNQSVIEYLINLANSNFEEWRAEYPGLNFTEFPFEIERLGNSSMLFNIDKLNSIAKDIVASYSADKVYAHVVNWAKMYRPQLVHILTEDPDYSVQVLNVERTGDAPRKDLAKWEDVEEAYGFFFETLFEELVRDGYHGMPELKPQDIVDILNYLTDTLPVFAAEDKTRWLARLRRYATDNNYAARRKEYETHPELYKGWFGDIMMVFRVAISGKTFTPDLYEVIKVLGSERVERRLAKARHYFFAKIEAQ